MSDTAIKVENLSKSYRLGHLRKTESYNTLRDAFVSNSKNLVRKTRELFIGNDVISGSLVEEFWALKEINFEIKQGDRVGIIGRNGAGKSTLLKILSRITEPTKGRITLEGRVASLLEVGTGFHPELTGRENIYLNGSILGMSRAEVRNRFDEIVDFAEVERFLDTPVKRYSSGMYVRLAFAVAAHLDPEILIVDEVLAVGDIAFQKKCMSRMSEVGATGKTVLFVSHNMSAIEQLCSSVIMLNDGKVLHNSTDVKAAIHTYMSASDSEAGSEWTSTNDDFSNEWFSPIRIYLGNEVGELDSHAVGVNNKILLYVEGVCSSIDPALQVGAAIYAEDGTLICWTFSADDNQKWISFNEGKNTLRLEIPSYFLNEGHYRIELGVALFQRMWVLEPGKNSPSIQFQVRGGFLSSRYWTEKRPGYLAVRLNWERI